MFSKRNAIGLTLSGGVGILVESIVLDLVRTRKFNLPV